MNPTSASPAAQRLQRLTGFLEQDPSNPTLLAEVFDAALACGDQARALACIDAATALAIDPALWTFRRAQLAVAQRELATAAELLQQLIASEGAHPAFVHDLAYVHLLQGELDIANDLLRPWLAPAGSAGQDPAQQAALQVLWLRVQHRLERIDDALAWVRAQIEAGLLRAPALGVASLIAIDADDLGSAARWSEAALNADPLQFEALVARGSALLAQGDPQHATQLLEQALQRHPDDGRTWSALGFASLRLMDLPRAQAQLERALGIMPTHADTWRALGWTGVLRSDHPRALAAFQRACELDPSDADSIAAQGLVHAVVGEQSQAAQLIEAAEQRNPACVTARLARAVLAGDVKGMQAVQELARRMVQA